MGTDAVKPLRYRGIRLPARRHRQGGAVLYVALIMLILLALIGIVGMQVTGMQERMAANYRSVNLAFQNAETEARTIEEGIEAKIGSGSGTYVADQEVCSPTFDPLSWADGKDASRPVANKNSATYTRRIDRCFAASSRRVGAKENEQTGNIYEVAVVRSDFDTNPTATAVIDTIFIP